MTATITRIHTIAPSRRAVGWWLIAIALVVAAMVTVGGLTRLTGSGLSITEWKPISGVIPPLNQQSWQAEFANYQKIPQYWRENRGMTLAQFKGIFWWEWSHRLLGRLLGVVFLLPFIGFAVTGAIPKRDWPRMVLLFALGGLQGVVGWWMVKSGLETRVSVSQYRLAIHLGVAIILFGALLWTAFDYLRGGQPRSPAGKSTLGAGAFALVGLVYVQMLLGALVAGLHAGLIYNTWPSMNGRFMPEDAFSQQPWWSNFFENPGTAQFDHRLVAYIVAAASLTFWFLTRQMHAGKRICASSNALMAAVLLQIALGIATLLNQAPLALAAVHQAAAVFVFTTALWNAFEVRNSDSN
ncbi:MAG TPA: COX15/CtaA family protein [Rhizomicrobium sp.]|jgi:cytochrome c oxidase assembly protein subunit 15|nr:COX15/CtaA family protein [Rhizomicrobium sp.]